MRPTRYHLCSTEKVLRKRVRWILLFLLALGLSWFSCVAVSIWRFGYQENTQSCDCAIVLGAAVSGSSPSPVFEERIKHGIALYDHGTVRRLIFTGGLGSHENSSESRVAMNYANRAGVPVTDVLIEEVSGTTRENLVEAKKLMDSNNLTSAIIVSDPFHLKRAHVMANDLGIENVTSATPTSR